MIEGKPTDQTEEIASLQFANVLYWRGGEAKL